MNKTNLKREDIVKAISGILIVFAFIAVISLFANAFDSGVSASPGDSSGGGSSNDSPGGGSPELPPTAEYITFYVDDVEYQAYKGATWSDFVKTNEDQGFKQMESAGEALVAKQNDTETYNDYLITDDDNIVYTSFEIKPDTKYDISDAYRIIDGVYVFNKTVTTVPAEFPILFKTNYESYSKILGNSENLAYFDSKNMLMGIPYESGTWSDINYRFINVTETAVVTKELYEWFDANSRPCEIVFGTYKLPEVIDFSPFIELYSEDEILDIMLPAPSIIAGYECAFTSGGNFPYDTIRLFLEDNYMYYLMAASPDGDNPHKYMGAYYNGSWTGDSWRVINVPTTLEISKVDKDGNIYDNTRDIFLLMEQAEYLGSS